MSFDNAIVPQELIIIDRVIDTLKNPKYWCKFVLKSYQQQYCLMGALNLADHKNEFYTFCYDNTYNYKLATNNVIEEMANILDTIGLNFNSDDSSINKIVKFNNRASTKHKDILNLLKKTRKVFE